MSREETTTSDYLEQIRKLGINPAKVHRNLEVTKLVSHSVSNGDGKIASTGSLAVKTGKYTGRSPDDRFIVKDNLTNDTVDWGKINHPIAPDKFDGIFERLKQHLRDCPLTIKRSSGDLPVYFPVFTASEPVDAIFPSPFETECDTSLVTSRFLCTLAGFMPSFLICSR